MVFQKVLQNSCRFGFQMENERDNAIRSETMGGRHSSTMRAGDSKRERERERRENRGVHSCHGCMIITDSSVIEDLLTAFHYQQQTYNETERRGGG